MPNVLQSLPPNSGAVQPHENLDKSTTRFDFMYPQGERINDHRKSIYDLAVTYDNSSQRQTILHDKLQEKHNHRNELITSSHHDNNVLNSRHDILNERRVEDFRKNPLRRDNIQGNLLKRVENSENRLDSLTELPDKGLKNNRFERPRHDGHDQIQLNEPNREIGIHGVPRSEPSVNGHLDYTKHCLSPTSNTNNNNNNNNNINLMDTSVQRPKEHFVPTTELSSPHTKVDQTIFNGSIDLTRTTNLRNEQLYPRDEFGSPKDSGYPNYEQRKKRADSSKERISPVIFLKLLLK